MKRRVRWGRVVLALFVCAGGMVVLIVAFAALRGALANYPRYAPAAPQFSVTLGAYHVHSTESDGRGSTTEIAQAASRAGLGFVILTDHNVVPEAPRWVNGVLVISGVEVSTRDGHLVVLGGVAPKKGSTGAEAIGLAAEAKEAIAVLAHPVQRKNPWRDWPAARNVRGFELYSADTFFRDAMSAPLTRLLPAIGGWLGNGLHGTLLLVTEQRRPMARLLQREPQGGALALCSHDAHGYPPYEDVFRAMSVQIEGRLDLNAAVAAEQVLESLRSGAALCVFHGLGSGAGFELQGLGPERTAKVGEVLRVAHPALGREDVEVRVSGPGAIEPDGRSVRTTSPGLVLIELWMRAPGRIFGDEWRPWIVPSPVRVLSAP